MFAIAVIVIVVLAFVAGMAVGIIQDIKARKDAAIVAQEDEEIKLARIDRELSQIHWTKEDMYGIKQRRQRRGNSANHPKPKP